MPVALHVYIREKNAKATDPILVEHVFYAATEELADAKRLAHLAGCEYYALAEAEGRTMESLEEISSVEIPTWEDVTEEDDEPIEVEGGPIEGDE